MKHNIDTTAPLSATDAERRLNQNLRNTYRRGTLVVNALHCIVTALLVLALSVPFLSIAPCTAVTGSDKSQNDYMITIMEQTLMLS